MEQYPYNEIPQDNYQNYGVPILPSTEEIKNIVSQINPNKIINDLNQVFQGKYQESPGVWKMTSSKQPLINDACRGYLITFISGVLNNSTTMGNIDKNKLSQLMESVIDAITRNFACRLEEFGFVPPGETYKNGIYQNKGTPDSARMTMVSTMVYIVCFMVFTRSLDGQESRRIFGSLKMMDTMSGMNMPQPKKSWLSKVFGS